MQDVADSTIYEFDDFRFVAKTRRLNRKSSGEYVRLQPKAAELLLFLLKNDGRILTKGELLETVWGENFVEESNLSQTVFILRKALGELHKTPQFILTVPNRGYQFISEVKKILIEDAILDVDILTERKTFQVPKSEFQVPSSEIKNQKSNIKNQTFLWLTIPLVLLIAFGVYWFYPNTTPSKISEIKTIAVLPFEDLSEGQTNKYLGVSLADALANKFGELKQITVRPTRSVLKYSESREDAAKIGRELQVDAVLDGRIQRIGEQVRVNVQLIRTSDNATIWAEQFDDKFTNFFAVQDSISQMVVQSLALKLNEKEREKFNRRGTENAEAYQEYLLGRFFWNKRSATDLDSAIKHFQRAVELDGNFAQAFAGLAETHAIYPFYAVVPDKESLPKARIAANRALEIDGESAEAQTVLGYVQSQYDFNWQEAEKSYKRAIELNPNHATTHQWYGEFLAFQGRFDESLAQMQKAVELDPTSLSAVNAPALVYNASRQFDKTLETTDKVLQMDSGFLIAKHYKARALFFSGRQTQALELYRKVVTESKESIFFKADLGCLYGLAGNTAEARRILAEFTETAKTKYVSPYYFANVYIGLGEKEKAFELLRKAVAEKDNNVIVMKVGLNFDTVREDAQFQKILKSVNLHSENGFNF